MWLAPVRPLPNLLLTEAWLLPPSGPVATSSHLDVSSSRSGDHLAKLVEQGHLDMAVDALCRTKNQGVVPSADIYRCLLKACTKKRALFQARRVHAHLAKHGLEGTRCLGESVVSAFVKCGGLEDAVEVFHKLKKRSVISWTAVINGHSTSGKNKEALSLYRSMQEEGVRPDAYTFVSLLKACGGISDLKEGMVIHSEVVKYSSRRKGESWRSFPTL